MNERFCKQNMLASKKCVTTPFARKEQLFKKIRRVAFQPWHVTQRPRDVSGDPSLRADLG